MLTVTKSPDGHFTAGAIWNPISFRGFFSDVSIAPRSWRASHPASTLVSLLHMGIVVGTHSWSRCQGLCIEMVFPPAFFWGRLEDRAGICGIHEARHIAMIIEAICKSIDKNDRSMYSSVHIG